MMHVNFMTEGLVPDLDKQIFYPARLLISEGRISSILPMEKTTKATLSALPYVLPGFVDSHVHIESSMLVPSEFARLAVAHGTIATISDPHEIANVCGLEGVEYMINDGKQVPFKFFFGAPSCVPATQFETSGSTLGPLEVEKLLQDDRIKYLSEMMNYPGVLSRDPEVMAKIKAAKKYGKPVDGHAPGLTGDSAQKYIDSGITTDHECFTIEEARNKLKYGMKIMIREGSAAKNFDALIELLHEFPKQIMFCSDDKHPDSLVHGHINQLCSRAIEKGVDVFKVIEAACVTPVLHYDLEVGLLRVGDPADFILIQDLKSFRILKTYIDGILVAEEGQTKIPRRKSSKINQFNIGKIDCENLSFEDADLSIDEEGNILLIEALDSQLITNKQSYPAKHLRSPDGCWDSNLEHDILKIAVINRYQNAPIAKAFIKNFGLKQGAMASSVSHDSHNIIAVGSKDSSMCDAINLIIENKGGICFCQDSDGGKPFLRDIIPLPVGGLMSVHDGYEVASAYQQIDKHVKEAGCTLSSPFMTLSFMALLVIPSLKLSDLGLFDTDNFCFV